MRDEVQLFLMVTSKKGGATKKEVFDAASFFGIEFSEKIWRKLYYINKNYEHSVLYENNKWRNCDYDDTLKIRCVLSQPTDIFCWNFPLDNFHRVYRDKIRQYFNIHELWKHHPNPYIP